MGSVYFISVDLKPEVNLNALLGDLAKKYRDITQAFVWNEDDCSNIRLILQVLPNEVSVQAIEDHLATIPERDGAVIKSMKVTVYSRIEPDTLSRGNAP